MAETLDKPMLAGHGQQIFSNLLDRDHAGGVSAGGAEMTAVGSWGGARVLV
jgi:hypothetical protein